MLSLAAGVAVGAGSLGVMPVAALALAAWVGWKAAANAMSRREEARADRVAYSRLGERYVGALKRITSALSHERPDLPGRVEDVLFSHPSVHNRIADMRAHAETEQRAASQAT